MSPRRSRPSRSVLLLDEPSAGPRRPSSSASPRLLGGCASAGIAVLLVEHNLRLVRAVADEVVVLAAGLVIAAGTPDEVARDPACAAAYLGRRQL